MKDITIEQAISRVEEIVAKLGDNSVTLDESLKLYTEGMKLSEQCLKKIDEAEQVVEQHIVKGV